MVHLPETAPGAPKTSVTTPSRLAPSLVSAWPPKTGRPHPEKQLTYLVGVTHGLGQQVERHVRAVNQQALPVGQGACVAEDLQGGGVGVEADEGGVSGRFGLGQVDDAVAVAVRAGGRAAGHAVGR